ncbi:MAG: zinc-dependent peptidase [Flavobacteriales bacterium]|nr:zinc-dependent peptidase [Flavobacteriales bacterium]
MPMTLATQGNPIGALVLIGTLAVMVVAQGVHVSRRSRRLNELLERSFAYYRGLDPAARSHFRERVRHFISEKDFHGRGITVTKEMEVLLAACAVQLTFGLPRLALEHFTKIIVYPDRYRSRMTGSDHVGEVNPGLRAIVISWKHFLSDYAVPDNARNLGLHEMAHALWFENRIPNDEHDFLDRRSMATWRALAQEEATRIHAGKSRLFRDYAGTNQEEFFAVAVEYFFEQPRQFDRELPDLYATMVRMLGQDPAR